MAKFCAMYAGMSNRASASRSLANAPDQSGALAKHTNATALHIDLEEMLIEIAVS